MKYLKEIIRRIITFKIINKILIRILLILKPLIPKKILIRFPVTGMIRLKTNNNKQINLFSDKGTDTIAKRIFWYGEDSYEKQTTSLIKKLIAGKKTIIDIGANTGFLTLMMAAYSENTKIYSFEPVPIIFEKLKYNISINNFNNIYVHQNAVSNLNDKVSFYVPLVNSIPLSSSLDKHFMKNTKNISVEAITMDRFKKDNAIDKIDFIKIDVENNAHEVLEGMTEILQKDQPDIICEILKNSKKEEIEGILKENNYKIYPISKELFISIDSFAHFPDQGIHNYLFSVNERIE